MRTQEELDMLGKWLGYFRLERCKHAQNKFDALAATHVVRFTEEQLFCEIDDRCVTLGLEPCMTTSEHINATVRAYVIGGFHGPAKWSGQGPDRLTAAGLAVINMLRDK